MSKFEEAQFNFLSSVNGGVAWIYLNDIYKIFGNSWKQVEFDNFLQLWYSFHRLVQGGSDYLPKNRIVVESNLEATYGGCE